MPAMKITTVEQLIAELGGTTAAARVFGRLPSAVSNWKAAGRLPKAAHYDATMVARERGWELADTLFGEPPPPVASDTAEHDAATPLAAETEATALRRSVA